MNKTTRREALARLSERNIGCPRAITLGGAPAIDAWIEEQEKLEERPSRAGADIFDMAVIEMDDDRLIEILEGIAAKATELAHTVRADGFAAVVELISDVPEPELFLRWGRAVQGDELPSESGVPSDRAVLGVAAAAAVTSPPPQQKTPRQPKPAKVTPGPRRRRVNVEKRCAGTTKRGTPCRRSAIVGDKYCPQHGGKAAPDRHSTKAKA